MIKKIIPNALTSLNLVCGILGILFCFSENLPWASYCILLAAVFDFLDGFVARLLKVNGEFGKQLDSLADVVTFGALPAIILFQMISITYGEYYTPFADRPIMHVLAQLSAVSIAVFSALRLAKFNLDTRQSTDFIGVPTPANALFVASFALLLESQYALNMYNPISPDAFIYLQGRYWYDFDVFIIQLLYKPSFYISYALIMSYLLVSEFTMLSLKFKSVSFKENRFKYIFILFCVLTTFLCIYYDRFYLSLFIGFLGYLLFSGLALFFWKSSDKTIPSTNTLEQ